LTNLTKWRKREPVLVLVVVAFLALLLPLLAVLQYRWLGQLSQAERTQIRDFLQVAASRFSQDFNNELMVAMEDFAVGPMPPGGMPDLDLKAKYAKWTATSQFPHLIQDIWLATMEADGRLKLSRLMPATGALQPSMWPANLGALRSNLERPYQLDQRRFTPPEPDRRTPRGGPMGGISMLADDPPVLTIPVFSTPAARPQSEDPPVQPQAFILLELSMNAIREEVLPSLVLRHFPGSSGQNFHISIFRRNDPQTVIFRSGPMPASSEGPDGQMLTPGNPDVAAGLFGVRFGRFPRPTKGPASENEAPRGGGPMRANPFSGRGRPGGEPRPGDSGPGMFGDPRGNELWEMWIQHRAGSLEAAVTEARNRNLAISFGILLLLGGSVISIAISNRRAHRLARQQIEFVAAVTHELRTPLAVIHTASQNLADGVIKGDEQTARYGSLISKESRRLAGMIEQVLEFASDHSRREPLRLASLSVADLIDNALAATQPLIGEGQFEIEKQIEADLPEIMADEPVLRRALQNLLDNSMKYSGSSRWIGVRARRVRGRKGAEIEVSIEDHGMGIPQNELHRIFEPFFRGKAISSTAIHGNGLGLSLVKSIVSAHHGRITVDSRMGRGTMISILLPVARGHHDAGMPQPGNVDRSKGKAS